MLCHHLRTADNGRAILSRLQDDHRDLAVGILLVPVVARPLVSHDLPEPWLLRRRGGASPPDGPPPSNSSPPSYLASSGGSVSCDYLIAFSGTAPAGNIASVKNDVWVLVGDMFVTQTASNSETPPFGSPPPVVPEAGLPILLPLAGLLLLGIVVVARRRRLASG